MWMKLHNLNENYPEWKIHSHNIAFNFQRHAQLNVARHNFLSPSPAGHWRRVAASSQQYPIQRRITSHKRTSAKKSIENLHIFLQWQHPNSFSPTRNKRKQKRRNTLQVYLIMVKEQGWALSTRVPLRGFKGSGRESYQLTISYRRRLNRTNRVDPSFGLLLLRIGEGNCLNALHTHRQRAPVAWKDSRFIWNTPSTTGGLGVWHAEVWVQVGQGWLRRIGLEI